MFSIPIKRKSHPLDQAIYNAVQEIETLGSGVDEASAAVMNLRVLMELRQSDQDFHRMPVVTPEAIASIAANLLSIGLILGFEKANVITTKSMAFVPKTKI